MPGSGGARCVVEVTDGSGSHADVSSGHRDVSSIEINVVTTAITPEIIRMRRKTALRQLKWLRKLHECLKACIWMHTELETRQCKEVSCSVYKILPFHVFTHIMSISNVLHVCNSCLATDVIADVIDSMFFFSLSSCLSFSFNRTVPPYHINSSCQLSYVIPSLHSPSPTTMFKTIPYLDVPQGTLYLFFQDLYLVFQPL